MTEERYAGAKEMYRAVGVDTEKAIQQVMNIPVSMQCWQGDDVIGFDQKGPLSGGIQATGSYPGRAGTPEELMQDMDEAMKLIPGAKKINLHASYAIFKEGEWVDRNALKPEHFEPWVRYAKERGLGIDFNPTMFSHPLAAEATLSSEKEEVRKFWIRHCQACLKIAEFFAEETGQPCVMNIWIPDGFKNIPADRTSPRRRLKESLDEILSVPYDHQKVYVCVESKVFGIGMESMTVGSHEFYMNYAASHDDVLCLLDTGHFHPTEMVSDKISSMLLFKDKLALHVSRPVRWDSDHVVLFDDETREIASEVIRNGADRVFLAMDFFDASINRIAAWAIGMRSMQKALLYAALLPQAEMAKLQNDRNFTKLMMRQEEMKTMPFGDVWDEYCRRSHVPTEDEWFKEAERYEKEVLTARK
jgi:L-rhamnose isomerase